MSEAGGFRGGRFKGRGRHSPYSRGGAGGGGGGGYRKVQRNNDGGVSVKNEPDKSFHDAGLSPTADGVQSKQQQTAGLMGAPHSSDSRASRARDGPSPSRAHSGSDHAPAQADEDVVREKKYSVKARLFVGNLPKDTSQDIVKELFQRFGLVKEVFVQREKNFGFIRMVSSLHTHLGVSRKSSYPVLGIKLAEQVVCGGMPGIIVV